MRKVSKLRKVRLIEGLSLYEVAGATGISEPHLSLIERGFGTLSPEKKRLLADYFSQSVEDLFPGEKDNR